MCADRNKTSEEELAAARMLLEQRNLDRLSELKSQQEATRMERAATAARAEQDAIRGPAPTPDGAVKASPDLQPLMDKHVSRLEQVDRTQQEKLRTELDAELARLDDLKNAKLVEGRTANQLARDVIEPLPERLERSTKRQLDAEFNAQAEKSEGLDERRIEIRHQGALDDRHQKGVEKEVAAAKSPTEAFNWQTLTPEQLAAEKERLYQEKLAERKARAAAKKLGLGEEGPGPEL